MIKLGDEIVGQFTFPDNSLRMILPTPNNWTITWNYENDAELFSIIYLRKHYEGIPMQLRMDYVPHARMDRAPRPEDVFTLKYFCEVINSLNFEKVTIVDPHSDVCVEMLNNVEVITAAANIAKAHTLAFEDAQEEIILFYPDKGALNRYWPLFPGNGKATFGMKVRNWESGKIEALEINDPSLIKDKNILIVDDICSYGGTFAWAAERLKEAGAKNIYLYVTHCEDNIFKGKIFEQGNIKHIYTTRSIYRGNDERITVI